LASTTEDVIGVWSWQAKVAGLPHWYLELKADGTFTISMSKDRDWGKFWFEGTHLVFDSAPDSVDCPTGPASYEVYVTREGNKAIQLRFVLIGEEPCAARKWGLHNNTLTPVEP